MRADALKALEQRKNSVMQEKQKKKMETLGVGNKYNNQPKVTNLGTNFRCSRYYVEAILEGGAFHLEGGKLIAFLVQQQADQSFQSR